MNVILSGRVARSVRLALFSANFVMLLAMFPLPASAADNGRQLYLAHCSGCHGTNGISVIPEAKNFSRAELFTRTDQNLIDIIRSGRNMMPAYVGILNDQEVTVIINYLRTLN